MAETSTHKRLKMVGSAYLKRICGDMACTEVPFTNMKSIADVCGLRFKNKEVRVIEVKATYEDYIRDKKLFELSKSYFPHCHYFYIMCPTNVIPKSKYVDDTNHITIVQRPTKNRMALRTRFDTTWKRLCRVITNQIIYRLYKCHEHTQLVKERKKSNATTTKKHK